MSHIVDSCPLTKLAGGLSKLHSADDDAVTWLIKAPFTRYNLLSNRLSNLFDNRFDNRLDVCLHDTAGCHTGCTTGLTTGCIV